MVDRLPVHAHGNHAGGRQASSGQCRTDRLNILPGYSQVNRAELRQGEGLAQANSHDLFAQRDRVGGVDMGQHFDIGLRQTSVCPLEAGQHHVYPVQAGA